MDSIFFQVSSVDLATAASALPTIVVINSTRTNADTVAVALVTEVSVSTTAVAATAAAVCVGGALRQ